MTSLSGWGGYPAIETTIAAPQSREAIRIAAARDEGLIARGNGRSYGDAAIGSQRTLSTLKLDRMRAFDAKAAILTIEAGALLSDVIATFGPRGYFPFVVPGTKHVTIGGAIAADVHGKNHHRDGGFGNYVESLVLVTTGGQTIRTSRVENAELFDATIGGMGLTGIIIEAQLRLRPIETGWIRQKTVVAPRLDAALAALEETDSANYSVAWIDCLARGSNLGRSLIFVGEHMRRDELDENAARQPFPRLRNPRLSIPFAAPNVFLNKWSIGGFNEIYFRRGAANAGEFSAIPLDRYFFPLDGIANWNRLYGRQGFVQHQCVLPSSVALPFLEEILNRVAARGNASFLAVLKKLGTANGLLSFPLPGYTLALDFPIESGILSFLHTLDELVVAAGGRLYLAKDARQSAATFEAGYPELSRFRDIRRAIDAKGSLRSKLAERLNI
jgi:decaprenylphospho-beta-D-ribofuranose 2-oxidase